jgi:hypothetical protein
VLEGLLQQIILDQHQYPLVLQVVLEVVTLHKEVVVRVELEAQQQHHQLKIPFLSMAPPELAEDQLKEEEEMVEIF